ncbi:hypothetical protein E3P89_01611 [Wallemia ichthyophaga]|uniref:tRNA-splicing endonuclease subunit Sen54 N-terminal domain-containing protein n=1 Tax=Wallemia ichthyophaga TaxID=245174 RepID=A0A4T0GIV8_WALIC|nr:hypothetical protein E3P95_01768 [Wallemia ichthyophaga]TIB01383.1 hypothetical protein E3P94_01816 [Wallemia ichthyophaga]TIB12525.1 hypothetical protein E3P90_01996 [Wallemia ichthyophaga]TIB14134.1 hypothetical protein E3P93_01746 [Wallemia ichthyophaga]TIB23378.1 hypothetical protein E3P89_01611 [Wallemia ichthyophaga]
MDQDEFKIAQNNSDDSDENDSAEDEVPDYRQLASFTNRKSKETYIPRRGEKEFEPSGLKIQQKALDESRDAMFNAIDGVRQSSNKNISIGLWSNAHSRASIIIQRGTHFSSIGHPVRNTPSKREGNVEKVASETRMELLPEEALYMVERGSLLCYEYEWSDNNDKMLKLSTNDSAVDERVAGLAPFSAQRAFDCCIGKDGLTLEKYTVYAQLKRLGYIVKRAQQQQIKPGEQPGLLGRIRNTLKGIVNTIFSPIASFVRLFNFRVTTLLGSRSSFLRPHQNYDSIFKALRLTPWGYNDTPEVSTRLSEEQQHEFDVTWDIWRPSSKFRKSAPPPPDFRIVVVDTHKSSLPSLEQFAHIFSHQPYSQPPLTRKQKLAKEKEEKNGKKPELAVSEISWFSRWWNRKQLAADESNRKKSPAVMFPALKHGKRAVVFAIVDSGTTSWIQFGEGQFGEFPLY